MDVSPAVCIALLVVGIAFIIYFAPCAGGREGFASARAHEVHNRAREVFAEGGADASYSDYKKKVPGADPVQYSDVRRLYREGQLTPGAIETIL